MTVNELKDYVCDRYGTAPDYPWEDDESFVFRHRENKKWLALVMEIPSAKLGFDGGNVAVMNVKVDPVERGSLIQSEGVYTAYHMNKEHWVTVLLSQAETGLIEWLIERSFVLTDRKAKKPRKKEQ